MSGRIEGLPCEFAALVAASITVLESFAPGYVRYQREDRYASLVVFHLLGDDVIGDYGAIELRFLRAGRCALRFHDPSKAPERWSAAERAGLAELLDQIPDLEAYEAAAAAVVKRKRQEAAELQRGKQRRHDATVKAFLQRLSQERIWTPAAREMLTKADGGATKAKGGRPRNKDDDWAWEQAYILHRDRKEVKGEWITRLGETWELALDPERRWRYAIDRRRKKPEKTD